MSKLTKDNDSVYIYTDTQRGLNKACIALRTDNVYLNGAFTRKELLAIARTVERVREKSKRWEELKVKMEEEIRADVAQLALEWEQEIAK